MPSGIRFNGFKTLQFEKKKKNNFTMHLIKTQLIFPFKKKIKIKTQFSVCKICGLKK
jgi:hypothetical protein